MVTNTHNGYRNYQTWCLASWIDNSESLYNRFHIFIRDARKEEFPRDKLKSLLINDLRNYTIRARPKNNSFWDSITNDVATEMIDYREIVELMLQEEGYEEV